MRLAHFLKANKGCEHPHAAIWTDTETKPHVESKGTVSHHLWFGWAAYSRTNPRGEWTDPEWCRFTTPASFWDWVEGRARAKTRLYIFAHNWSFDAPVLAMFQELPKRGWTLSRAIIESPPVILSWRKGDCTILVMDTLNVWRVSLASLGESLGLSKLKMPTLRNKRETWDAYCRRDVEVIREALLRWWRFLGEHDLGGFAHTLAGQAFRSYRHRFMPAQILIDDDAEALDVARRSYHGGRCECFRIGRVKGKIHCYDVTSMYPHVMRTNFYPARLASVATQVSKRELRGLCKRFCVVADVDLETDEPAYAHIMEGRLCFPTGRIRECLTTPDLEYALARKHLRAIRTVAIYDRAKLFETFVDEMWNHRLKAIESGDAVSAFMFKILMNSLYGKFGQRSGKWEHHSRTTDQTVKVYDEVDADSGRVLSLRQFSGLVQQRYHEGEARESHPAIAAHVTAYARRHLWRLIQCAGIEHTLYCDTDSVWCDAIGASSLAPFVSPRTLGALKLEHVYPWVEIRGAKDYSTPLERKVKGVRAKAVWLSSDTIRQEKWSSLRGLLRRGDLSAPLTSTIVKRLSRRYTKGNVSPSGKVSPLTADEW